MTNNEISLTNFIKADKPAEKFKNGEVIIIGGIGRITLTSFAFDIAVNAVKVNKNIVYVHSPANYFRILKNIPLKIARKENVANFDEDKQQKLQRLLETIEQVQQNHNKEINIIDKLKEKAVYKKCLQNKTNYKIDLILSDCLDYSTLEKEILFYKSIAEKLNIPVIIFADSRHIEINTESKENIKTEEGEFVLIKPILKERNI